MLSAAGASGLMQRDHDRERGVHGSATEVSNLQAGHRRTALGGAAEQEHAGNRRVVDVVAGAVAKRSILAITADAAEHDPRVHLAQRGKPDAESIHHSRSEALDDHVGGRGKAEKCLTPHGILEIDRERALVAVERVEHRRVLIHERRHPAQVVTAGGVLDLDDVGAEVGQEHSAEWPREQPGQIEDSNVVECRHGRASVSITRRPRFAEPLC